MSERQALRRNFRAKRRALSRELQKQHALAITRILTNSDEMLRSQRIGLYLANDGEVDLTPLANELANRKKQLALPVIGQRREMDFYRYQPGDKLLPNRFGIPEPAPGASFVEGRSLDLLLIPLVAFDAAGTRLGMGAGYYDRYLGRLEPHMRPRTIGVAYSIQRSEKPLPAEPWDIPLDRVVTEAGWQRGD